jgi:hypothetical protein
MWGVGHVGYALRPGAEGRSGKADTAAAGGSYVRHVSPHFLAERSVSSVTGAERWVVVDAGTYALHPQACAYLASLRSRG